MGYELVEQLGWTYPDAVFYPTGGGVGLIGMWKAFEEMEQLGWVKRQAPRRCTPSRPPAALPSPTPTTKASPPASSSRTPPPLPPASASPSPTATPSSSTSSASPAAKPSPSPTKRILASILDWAKHEGIFLSPEGAAATAAYDTLIATGDLKPTDRVVLFNTGAGLKYTDMTAEAMHLKRPGILPKSMPVGGIITPQ